MIDQVKIAFTILTQSIWTKLCRPRLTTSEVSDRVYTIYHSSNSFLTHEHVVKWNYEISAQV